jgi:hypothetical protein
MKTEMQNWRNHLLTEDVKKQIENELIMFLESEDLDEGIMDRLLPYVLAGGAALGGMAGTAQAKPISQDAAAQRIVQVLNQKDIKDQSGLDVTFYDFDSGVQDVAKQISILSKTVPDKDEGALIDIVANGIEANYKNGIPKDTNFDTAEDAVKLSVSKIKKRQRSKKMAGAQKFKTGDARLAALNSLNNISADMMQKRDTGDSVSRFVKDLKVAVKNGAISKSEYNQIKDVMKGDQSNKLSLVSDILQKGVKQ